MLYVLLEGAESMEMNPVFPILSGKWKNKEAKNEVSIILWEHYHIFLMNPIQESLSWVF